MKKHNLFNYLNIVSLLCIQTIGKAVGDWFYDRKVVQLIDCTYPCNPTCKDLVEDSLQGQQIANLFLEATILDFDGHKL